MFVATSLNITLFNNMISLLSASHMRSLIKKGDHMNER